MTLLEQKNESIIVEITQGDASNLKRVLLNVRHDIYQIKTRRKILFDENLANSLFYRFKTLFEPLGRGLPRTDERYKEDMKKIQEMFQETKLIELTTNELLLIQSFMEHVLEDKEFNSDIDTLVGCSLDKVKNLHSQIINFLK